MEMEDIELDEDEDNPQVAFFLPTYYPIDNPMVFVRAVYVSE